MADSDVLRSRLLNVAHAALGAVAALLGASALVVALNGGLDVGALVFAALLPTGMWFAIRSWRAGMLLGDDHVEVRGLFRTRRFARMDLTAVRVESSSSLIPWRSLTLDTAAGASVTVYEMSTLGSADGSLDDARRALAAWLAA